MQALTFDSADISLPNLAEKVIPHQTWISLTPEQQQGFCEVYPRLTHEYKAIAFVAYSLPNRILYLEATTSRYNTQPGIGEHYVITFALNGSIGQSRID